MGIAGLWAVSCRDTQRYVLTYEKLLKYVVVVLLFSNRANLWERRDAKPRV